MPKLLFVCTGNVCRSPVAAEFARRKIAPKNEDWTVTSAGLTGVSRAATTTAVVAMRHRGYDLRPHRSRLIWEALEDGSFDLVIGMAQEHVRAVVEQFPQLFNRTFVLKELVSLATVTGPRRPDQSLRDYLFAVGAERRLSHLARVDRRFDVTDPIGRGRACYEKCLTEIEALIDDFVRLLCP